MLISYKKSGGLGIIVMAIVYAGVFIEDVYLCNTFHRCVWRQGIFDSIYGFIFYPIAFLRKLTGLVDWVPLFQITSDRVKVTRDIISHVIIYLTDLAYVFFAGMIIKRLLYSIIKKLHRHEE